jgi:hypothetical protein
MHRAADERAWWKKSGIDPIKIARKLWKQTRLKEGRIASGRPLEGADQDDGGKSNQRHRSLPM